MKKRLNFIISLLLIFTLCAGSFIVPASSYENDVVTTSDSQLLVNLDTDTVCFAIEPDRKRFASYMSELITFITACDAIQSPEKKKVEVTQDFIDELPYSDGCIDIFIGQSLTVKDLLAIMMLSSGSDAAYLIADTVADGDIEKFVAMMNEKAHKIGCSRSQFVTPGYCESNEHYTTCRDIYKMFKKLYTIDLYKEIMESPTYIPPGFEIPETEDNSSARDRNKNKKVEQIYEITTQNSILNPSSPYYFRYATGGKYSYSPAALSNIMATTRYRGKSYIFVGMHGLNTSEENVFADARRMTTWAYLNLSDRKVIDSEDVISAYNVAAEWGEYDVALYASNSAYKTLPMKYEMDKFAYEINLPEHTPLPVFQGQSIGSAKIYYDGQKIDDVNLISSSAEGLSLLSDLSRFGLYAFSEILSNEPPTEETYENQPVIILVAPTVAPTAAPTEPPTAAPTEPPTEEEEEEEDEYYEEDWEW